VTADLIQQFDRLHHEVRACTACRADCLLHEDVGELRARPILQGGWTGRSRILLVTEAPNWDDTFAATKGYLTIDPKTDPTGQQTFRLLDSVGLGPDDVLVTNVVLCLPKKAETKDEATGKVKDIKFPVRAPQAGLCQRWLERHIAEFDPPAVVAFGGEALAAMNRIKPHGQDLASGVGRLHDWNGRTLLPMYHPGLRARQHRSAEQQVEDFKALVPLLPAGAKVRPSPPSASRIAVNGRFLDEVEIRLPKQAPRTVSTLRFPAARHSAHLDGDMLTLTVQAPTVVQLYFDGIIPVDRSVPVAVRIGDGDEQRFVIEGVGVGDRNGSHDEIVLRMRRTDPA
jgi:uracil-DNA glycosylase family 4